MGFLRKTAAILGMALLGTAFADESDIPTPGLTQAQVDQLRSSVRARCRSGLGCYQQQEAEQFNQFSSAYDQALRASDKIVREGLHHFCSDPRTGTTPFYEVAPCLLIYQQSLSDATRAAAEELSQLKPGENLNAWYARLQLDQSDNPKITGAMRTLAVAVHTKCPGVVPDRDCTRAYLDQLQRDEHVALEKAQDARNASSRLLQTSAACLLALNSADGCRRRHDLNPVSGERWAHALTEVTSADYQNRIPYQAETSARKGLHALLGGPGDAPHGTDPLLQCIRRKNGGADISGALTVEDACKAVSGTPLAQFSSEAIKITSHLSSQSYSDLVRLIGVSRLLDAHQRFIGTPLTSLPAACQGKLENGFHSFTGAAPKAETDDQRHALEAALQSKAHEVVSLLAAQADAKVEIERGKHLANGERCDYFIEGRPGQPKCATEQYTDATKLIERLFADYPLLSAGRDPTKIELEDPGQALAFASASPTELDALLAKSREKLSHSMSDGIAQLCSAGQADGLDWRELSELPLNDDPLWQERFPQFEAVRACMRETRYDERKRRKHAATALRVSCFFADFPTMGLATPVCEGAMALQQLDEAARSITWMGRCRAGGGALCDDQHMIRAQTAYEQSVVELIDAGKQAGMNVLALGGGLGFVHLSKAVDAGKLDFLVSKLRPVREGLNNGSIRNQARLDAWLKKIEEEAAAERAAEAAAESTGRATPTLTSTQLHEVSSRLGIEGPLELRPLSRGGMNNVYDFVSVDPHNPARFGSGPEIPAELRGQPVEGFKAKLSHTLSDAAAERDKLAYSAIKNRIETDPKYEGVHMADTFTIGDMSSGERLIVQRTVKGEGFGTILRDAMEPGPGHVKLSESGWQQFFATMFPDEAAKTHTIEEMFDPGNFRERIKNGVTYGELNELEPLLHLTDAEIGNLRATWESPDMSRIRELAFKLFELDRDPILVAANSPILDQRRSLLSTPLWTSYQVPVNGDFTAKNMLFWRSPDGHINLTLFDH